MSSITRRSGNLIFITGTEVENAVAKNQYGLSNYTVRMAVAEVNRPHADDAIAFITSDGRLLINWSRSDFQILTLSELEELATSVKDAKDVKDAMLN